MAYEEENDTRTILGSLSSFRKEVPKDIVPYLVVVEGTECGKTIEVGSNPIKVGRRSDNDLVLNDAFVSSHHCGIAFESGQLWVTDLNSTNGTYINGQRVQGRAKWPTNTLLQIGKQVLRQVSRRRAEMRRSNELAEDLRQASHYVQTLLPRPLGSGEITSSWHFLPSTALGGDIFDYFWLDGNRFVFYVLDVCGHGTGAALHSVSVFNLLRQKSIPSLDFTQPAQVLKALNDALPMQNYGGLYFTLWYGVYHRVNRTLTFASGGHPPALLFDKTSSRLVELRTPNPPIGIVEGLNYQEKTIALSGGGSIYLFSDGVYEVTTKSGEEWGWDNYVRLLENRHKRGSGSPETIFQDIRDLTLEGHFEDDFSLLLMSLGVG